LHIGSRDRKVSNMTSTPHAKIIMPDNATRFQLAHRIRAEFSLPESGFG